MAADFAGLCTAVGSLLELPAAQAARVLSSEKAQPSLAEAADALEHEATKLTLLVSNGLMPPWDAGAPRRCASHDQCAPLTLLAWSLVACSVPQTTARCSHTATWRP